MKLPVCLCLSGCVLLYGCTVRTEALCPQPDVPTHGNYTPKRSKFEPGDEITYSCSKGFGLSGKERRICKSNDVWSDHSPFCDYGAQLKNPSVTNENVLSALVSRVVDHKTNSCFEWLNATGEHMFVHLDKKIIIRTVKIFVKKGNVFVQLLTGVNNDMKLCADHGGFVETDRWILIKCKNNVQADTIKILVTSYKFLTVCEIEVYGKEEDGCDHSPNRRISNGHFEVSRSAATLICDDGFRNENHNRLVCEGNNTWTGGNLKCEDVLCDPIHLSGGPGVEWSFIDLYKKISVGTKSQMKCSTGYKKHGGLDISLCQKNGTWTKINATCVEEDKSTAQIRRIVLGVVAIVVVLIIISLLGAIVYFLRKQRNKEVVVVFQPQTDESVISGTKNEYCRSPIESLYGKAPEPPSTPRPMAKLSTMSRVQDIHPDDWQDTLQNKPIPMDINIGIMKSSTIYGS